jgi:predicted nucleotide-binding protein
MAVHFRAELLEHQRVGYQFNAAVDDLQAINKQLHNARAAVVGGIAVNPVWLAQGAVTLQVVETPEPLHLSGDLGSDWNTVLKAGRDVSSRLSPRDPIDIARDERKSADQRANIDPNSRDVFVVHGRDHTPLHHVARVLTQLGLNPVVLSEQPGRGETIIEKLQRHATAAFAVVLLTPDDIGYLSGEERAPRLRARQNVIFELGFFVGSLGRNRVCVLKKGDIELPSDWLGIVYMPLEDLGWQLELARELRAAGFDIDLNKL